MTVTTQPAAPATPDSDAVPEEPIYRLTVEQYHALARCGILDEDAPVELLEGWLVRKMTKYPPHRAVARRARRALERLVSAEWSVETQDPITTKDSEPEPDIMVVRAEAAARTDRHPVPEEVALIVEVAESSLRRDRGTKKRLYARAGIAAYWIVNLVEGQVEAYTQPTGPVKKPDYRQRDIYRAPDEIPVVINGVEIGRIPVSETLG
jgi:Uma2 family endonuclease